MISTKLRAFLAGTALVLLAGAAHAQTTPSAGAPKKGGTLQVVVTPEPPMLMQGLNQNGPTNMIAGNIYESLLRYDEKLNPQPSLAEELGDLAGREGLHLQAAGGREVARRQAVHGRRRRLHARQVPARGASALAADRQRAGREDREGRRPARSRFTLKQPFGPFLLAHEVASAPMIPKHIYEGTDYRANPANNTPIGTGPMKLKEWKKGSYIHLVPQRGLLAKDQPYLDEIYFQIIPDAAARAVAYRDRQGRRADRRRGRDLRRGAPVEAAEHLRDHQGLGDVRAPCLGDGQPAQRHPRQQARSARG